MRGSIQQVHASRTVPTHPNFDLKPTQDSQHPQAAQHPKPYEERCEFRLAVSDVAATVVRVVAEPVAHFVAVHQVLAESTVFVTHEAEAAKNCNRVQPVDPAITG